MELDQSYVWITTRRLNEEPAMPQEHPPPPLRAREAHPAELTAVMTRGLRRERNGSCSGECGAEYREPRLRGTAPVSESGAAQAVTR